MRKRVSRWDFGERRVSSTEATKQDLCHFLGKFFSERESWKGKWAKQTAIANSGPTRIGPSGLKKREMILRAVVYLVAHVSRNKSLELKSLTWYFVYWPIKSLHVSINEPPYLEPGPLALLSLWTFEESKPEQRLSMFFTIF